MTSEYEYKYERTLSERVPCGSTIPTVRVGIVVEKDAEAWFWIVRSDGSAAELHGRELPTLSDVEEFISRSREVS